MSPTKEELEFLWWLERFAGTWRVGDEDWDVGREDDGYLSVWPNPGRPTKPLAEVLRGGVKVAGPPDGLGPRPVCLSQPLIQVWLPPEQFDRFKGPGWVGAKIRAVLKALEESILALDEEERKRRWFILWTYFARVQPSEHDEPIWEELRAEFERETSHQRLE